MSSSNFILVKKKKTLFGGQIYKIALVCIVADPFSMGVFTCSILASIVTILVSIVVIPTSIEPILEKCGLGCFRLYSDVSKV